METTVQDNFDPAQETHARYWNINPIRFLYLALNDVVAFEQEVLAVRKNCFPAGSERNLYTDGLTSPTPRSFI